MLDARHEAENRLRRFVADASHELRTPVAATTRPNCDRSSRTWSPTR
jgi:hypothetical protein